MEREQQRRGEREVMTCSNYEECLLEIHERERGEEERRRGGGE